MQMISHFIERIDGADERICVGLAIGVMHYERQVYDRANA
jgi:hypothetical protein